MHLVVPSQTVLISHVPLSEEAFDKLPPSTVPEMQRSNLAPVILQLKALGIDNVLRFHFMSVSPSCHAVQSCREGVCARASGDGVGRHAIVLF